MLKSPAEVEIRNENTAHIEESQREVEISKANDDSYFRKSDVVEWLKSNDCFWWLAEVETKAVIEDLENIPIYSPKNNYNSAENNDNDLISRKAVLDLFKFECDNNCPYSEKERKVMCRACTTGNYIDYVEELPTIPQTDKTQEIIGTTSKILAEVFNKVVKMSNDELIELAKAIDNKPQTEEYCDTCKEYDKDKHYCPRFSRVIKDTLDDNVDSVLEDIKAEIDAMYDSNNYTDEFEHGIMAVKELINKHISGKE